ALEKLKLDEEKAEKFSKIKLNQGYATLSLSAIKKILPFLQKGFLYSQAVYLANLYKVLGADKITDDLLTHFAEEVGRIIQNNKQQKTVNNIVNALIAAELSDENRYSIEVDRELDDSEKRLIHQKIIEVFGEKSWDELGGEEQAEITAYVSRNFKDFLRKSVLSKRNVFIEQPRLHEQIWDFIVETYRVPDENKKYLWHPSEQESYVVAAEYQHYRLKDKDVYIAEK